ncbi:50S ribosomal protein L25 [bacterium]|nr:50S ribosomal protein L25 [bacterium]
MAQTAVAMKLDAKVREERGKEKAKKLRFAGMLPGVVYGSGKDAVSIVLDAHEFQLVRQAAHGDSVLIDLNVDNGDHDKVFIKALQRDPVTSKIEHVDLLRVDMNKEITLKVSVRQIGDTPLGVREGGLLEQVRYKVEVRCLPGNVPAHIEVDLTELGAGATFHISDLPVLEGVEYLEEPDTTIFSIVSKAKLEAAAFAAEEAAAAAGGEEGEAEAAEGEAEEGEAAEGEAKE